MKNMFNVTTVLPHKLILRAHIVKLCRGFSEDLCRKVVTNARVRLHEVVRQKGGHIEHVLH